MAAAGGGDVEAALKEADKAAKKQKVCSSSSEAAVDQLLQVGAGSGKMEVLGRSISNISSMAFLPLAPLKLLPMLGRAAG